MSAARRLEPMTLDDFLLWESRQTEKWELIGGVPQQRRMRMMAGGTRDHSRVAANFIIALAPKLRGGACGAFTSDLKVVCGNGAVRYPDASVDCGRGTGKELTALDPRVIVEVISKSNSFTDQVRALEDYKTVVGLAHIVFLSQDRAFGQTWSRDQAGLWTLAEADGLLAVIDLPAIGASLPLLELYDGVTPTDP